MDAQMMMLQTKRSDGEMEKRTRHQIHTKMVPPRLRVYSTRPMGPMGPNALPPPARLLHPGPAALRELSAQPAFDCCKAIQHGAHVLHIARDRRDANVANAKKRRGDGDVLEEERT